MTTDVESLIARVRLRDVDALASLIDARRGQLSAYIDRQLGQALRRKVEVEDIYQEVATEAVRALATIDLDGRDPFAWLCQLAERRIIDAHRRHFDASKRDAAREVPIHGSPDQSRAGIINLLVASMTTASQMYSRNLREVRLAEALATLPQEQREALRLRYMEGLPSKEIATQLGKSDGAVRVMLTRSLARLQSILGAEEEPAK